MRQTRNTGAIESGTRRSWDQWLAFLEEIDARNLPHKEIAQKVVETGDASGWWAQTITVAFEQHIGRRAPGQRADGSFEIAVSKTLPGSIDHAMDRWHGLVGTRDGFDGVAITGEPESSSTEKWRYWRCSLEDGSRISVTIGAKGGDKATLAVAHTRLDVPQEQERWRSFWKAELKAL